MNFLSLLPEYEVTALVLSFFVGSTVTVILLLVGSKSAWEYADLSWIVAGGSAAATALFISNVLSDAGELRRQSDLFSAKVSALNFETHAFLQIHCTSRSKRMPIQYLREDINFLCEQVAHLDQSTSSNSGFLRFTKLFGSQARYQVTESDEFELLKSGRQNNQPSVLRERLKEVDIDIEHFDDAFDLLEHLNENGSVDPKISGLPTIKGLPDEVDDFFSGSAKFFVALWGRDLAHPAEVKSGVESLLKSGLYDRFSFEFTNIWSIHNDILREIPEIDSKWQEIQSKQHLFFWRTMALCIVALVFPLRIGKTVYSINAKRRAV